MALTIAFVSEIVPASRTGTAMGLLGTMSAVGTTLGPALGGFLTAWAGTRAIFLINGPLGLIALLLLYRALPVDDGSRTVRLQNFDKSGMALLIFALVAYACAMTVDHGQFGIRALILLLAALGAGTAFVFVERAAASPLIRLDLFANSTICVGLCTSAIVTTVMMATLVVGPFYLNSALGIGPAMAGLALSVGPLVAAMMGLPAGRLVDRFGAGITSLLGLSGILAGSLALTLFPHSWGIAAYIGPIVVMTASYALFQTANNSAIMTGSIAAERGMVSGLLSLSRNFGLVTGASAMGAVFALGTATSDVGMAGSEAITSGMHLTFVVVAVMIFGALLFGCRTGVARTSEDRLK